ncbi:MAG: acetate--CoA ligase family protein, partial [Burkholderiales bacterium]
MSHYLAPLFAPSSVAIVGASTRSTSLGHVVLANVIGNGFAGRIVPVTPRYPEVMGIRTVPDLSALDAPVDLAVFATPAELTVRLIDALDPAKVRALLVLTAGFAEMGEEGKRRARALAEIVARKGIRMVGPNCLGLLRPSIGLNATFAPTRPQPGNLALVSQSGAACTVMLDWASARDIGFSSVISMGGALDLDFGEILDFLVHDPATEHILMYVEGVRDARGFVSSLRAAARTKPVIVLKVGRHASGSRAASSHSGALVGSDSVFSAVFERCGTIRVMTMNDLFTAASILAHGRMPRGDRLAVLTNGGGPGVLAADRAADRSVPLAALSESTISDLNAILPVHWSHANPVDVIGDADAERYGNAARVLARSEDCDVILGLFCPVALAGASDVARATIEVAAGTRKPFVTAWLGETEVAEARRLFAQSDIPSFRTPESAVDALSWLVQFRRNQALLLQTPSPRPLEAPFDRTAADRIREQAQARGRTLLTETESKALLGLFGVPVAANLIAQSPNEAVSHAEQIGYPVVMKINSSEISHKSDVGGVRLNLLNARMVRHAYEEMIEEVG